VGAIVRTVEGERLLMEVTDECLRHLDDASKPVARVPERRRTVMEGRRHLLDGDREREGNGPRGAVRQPQPLEDAPVVADSHEAGERAGRARCDELEIRDLSSGQGELRQASGAIAQLRCAVGVDVTVHEDASVGLGKTGHGASPCALRAAATRRRDGAGRPSVRVHVVRRERGETPRLAGRD
jgi:hypothetical protein